MRGHRKYTVKLMRSTAAGKLNEALTLVAICVSCAGLRGAEAMSLKGEKRGQISITCSHSNAYSNVKYFCRGACYDEDVLISTREKKDHAQRKYSIRDEGNTFYVTIFDLKKDDEGTYWCGIDRVGIDTYNKVVLTVSGELYCIVYE